MRMRAMKTPFLLFFLLLVVRAMGQESSADLSHSDIAVLESRSAGLRLNAPGLRVMASNNFDVNIIAANGRSTRR